MKIFEYIGSENSYRKENYQINRVEKIIIEWAKGNHVENIWFFRNVNYFHKSFGLRWSNQEWNGEIDLLFICEHHFVVFELKNKKGAVKGQTQKGIWSIQYYGSNEFIDEKDYFKQCSRMKTFFSQDYYPKKILSKIDQEYKLRHDVLLVF